MLHTYLTTVRNVDSETALYMNWTNVHVMTIWLMDGSTAHGSRTTSADFNIKEYIADIATYFDTTVDKVELQIISRK